MLNLLFASALIVAGCSNSGVALEEKSVAAKVSPAAEQVKDDPGSTPSMAQDDATKGSGGQVAGSGGTQDEKQDKKRFVKERVFQLDKLQVATVKVEKHTFKLWVMDTNAKRSEGMMHLENTDFKDDEGMIFVFLGEDWRRFWMRNTRVDLDICYCDKDGKILNTYTMAKFDETTDYSSTGPAMYVIELKAGILNKLGIKAGMKFQIPEDVVSKDE